MICVYKFNHIGHKNTAQFTSDNAHGEDVLGRNF